MPWARAACAVRLSIRTTFATGRATAKRTSPGSAKRARTFASSRAMGTDVPVVSPRRPRSSRRRAFDQRQQVAEVAFFPFRLVVPDEGKARVAWEARHIVAGRPLARPARRASGARARGRAARRAPSVRHAPYAAGSSGSRAARSAPSPRRPRRLPSLPTSPACARSRTIFRARPSKRSRGRRCVRSPVAAPGHVVAARSGSALDPSHPRDAGESPRGRRT